MTRAERLALAARAEDADGAETEAILREAAKLVLSDDLAIGSFVCKLGAEAYVDAALMLVPKHLFPRIYGESGQVILVGWTDTVGWEEVARSALCHSIALAIVAVCLRALAEECGE